MDYLVTSSIDREIGHFMVDKKITQTQMAKLHGITTNTLRAKREGRSDWSWSEILKLCNLLETTPDKLAGLAMA